MYSSGLRVSEVAKLKLGDLNLEERTGLLKKGKGGEVFVPKLKAYRLGDLKEVLVDLLKHH